jgi:uncharacterized protein YndB with AHSA1/START domain
MIDTSKGFTLVREFDATPAEIWHAWTHPDEAAQWLHPRGVSTPRDTVRIDARVGGRYAYTMVNDATGEKYPTGGVYREMVPFEKLVFTWGDPDDRPENCPLITVTIEPLGELTRMTLDLRGYDGARGDGNVFDGWESALDVLAEHLAQTEVRG